MRSRMDAPQREPALSLLLVGLTGSCAERDDGGSQSSTDDPAGAVEMRTPAGLGTAVANVQSHQRRGGVLPITTGVIGFEQRCVQREMAAIIIDHGLPCRRQRLNCDHPTVLLLDVEEYTPWIVTRQWLPIRSVSSRENLARNLKTLRTAKGLSQEALADAAGIDRTYVSALERRKYSLSIDRLDQLALSLGVEPHALLMSELPAVNS